ncbi:hypothetical protein KMZ93_04310 [Bradyrhizobium sediminis]|uniref:Type IV secretion system coupling protein TraD DNA-binding domain-containing protein n=1 Tax=Bradyrhizobium sediminis TaxID=2840469 RepID=A0A975P102_9BRAD|nr:hypothetical protein [Bradyrhizobium sediminis]QWG24159.1 hypothetical protein KMZ93_04310 [Bradyrhizobium sediminis]
MQHTITDHEIPGRDGVRVLVRLGISPEEHVLIFKYRMAADAIDFPVFYQGRKLVFGDFYGGTHTTIWDIDSPHQARAFIAGIRRGFADFEKFLESNRKPVQYEPPPVPWDFFDTDARFEGTWIKGEQGWGKTTLLSALIEEDLGKVAAGKASVIVIDSQNEHLGRFLPRLPRFAPGHDLHDKLVYLEPDLDHPLALNLLNFKGYGQLSKNEQFERSQTVLEMLNFFIGATIGEQSGHMKNIIGYCLRALALMPEPTIMDFKDLLVDGRLKNILKDKSSPLHKLDDATKRFLLTDLFKNYGPSLTAVANRLDAFDNNDMLKAFFSQPKNRFNFYELLRKPHVIVINTMERRLQTKEALGLFGRYFLALLMGVVRARTSGGLPCYVHVDECWQYIKDEPIVGELIATARRQKIALTFAQQHKGQITNTEVRKALQTCGVQIDTGKKQHHWNVQVRKGEVHEVSPPDVDFSKIDGMTDPEWQLVLDHMHETYCAEPPRAGKPDEEMPDAV